MWSPEEGAAALVAWRQFTEQGRLAPGVIPDDVAASWSRCRAAGLDPHAPKVTVRLSRRELDEVRARNRVLLDVAVPVMQFLETAVRGSGCILVMTDASGIVLDAFGDATVLRFAAENNYVPGCCRTEEEVGTNAIGLALVEKKPVHLTGAEHYNVRHHSWTCASAPIFAGKKLIGTVTLSGASVAAHRHTLGMVIAAAGAIAQRLEHRELEVEKERANDLLRSVLQSVSEAILAVDGDGVVTNANAEAARLLGLDAAGCVGHSLGQLFPGTDLSEVVRLRRSSGPIEIALDPKRGGGTFFVKPYLLGQAGEAASRGAILVVSERREFIRSVREISGGNARFTFEDIIGSHPALVKELDLAKAAARKDSRVLIIGETGTGKELLAHSIHNASFRRSGPFVAINCAAIPRELLESELMGYRDGAFSGARKGGQLGKLEFADSGTVFLDEIGQMPIDLQSKLLRVLQDGVVTRLGDTKSTRVDVRVIAATNEDLFEKSRQGGFRQDLYFRLSVVEINLPPLRRRREDIPAVAEHVLRQIAERCDRRGVVISERAMAVLLAYDWPGNIRELENVIEMALILCEGASIEPHHLHARLGRGRPLPDRVPVEAPTLLKDVEMDLLRATMHEMNGNVALVSRKLGISRSTIYRRLKEHGLRRRVQVG
jgi:sigma-54 dependent transcriptional regulator, acetoin dehydrogenase operon transcriptional activator AcoR